MGESKQKLVVVCRTMPPQVVGSAVLMRNLFQPFGESYEILAGWEHGAKVDPAFTPTATTHFLRFWPSALQRLMEFRLRSLYYRIARGFVYRKFKQIRPTAVFSACTPDGIFFVASFLACRRLGIPFWGHMHDLWLENTSPNSFAGKLARVWEPMIFREADKIFCMTESQVEHYKARYGKDCEIIPHCVPAEAETREVPAVRTKGHGEEFTILYGGSVSHAMNLDALRDFVACIDLLPKNYRVKMMIAGDAKIWKRNGIYHPRVEYGWASVAELQKQITQADVLLLPLSFKNCSEEEVRTVFATKTLDYLTSGTPILVHSPATSHHSQSAKSRGWGYVVDEDTPEALAEAIQELACNRELREQIVTHAFEEARRRNPRHWAKFIQSQLPRNESR